MFDESTLDRIPGVNIVSAVHPRKLFISGLSRLFTDPEVDLRKAELERAFRKYGGPTGAVAVSIQKNSGFAFVDVASEELADLAVAEMANNRQYRVNKARRTRHEALLEERAARETKEAEEGGGGTAGSKETAGWD
jgi:RNA recognition motif-containing protein